MIEIKHLYKRYGRFLEGDGTGVKLHDRLQEMLSDWGSRKAAPILYEGNEDGRLR